MKVPNSPYGPCGCKATLNLKHDRDQELWKVPNSPCGLCGRNATLNLTGLGS